MRPAGVAYLNGEERKQVLISIDNEGRSWRTSKNGVLPFDTNGWQSTGFPDYGAFVMATDGTMYSHEHVENEFHHSSFLAGDAVLAAGMIRAKDGWITVLDPKSGHYKPRLQDFFKLVSVLHRKGALREAKIHWAEYAADKKIEQVFTPDEFHDYVTKSAAMMMLARHRNKQKSAASKDVLA
ncbi:hypothetical protein AAKU55_004448 [Oxalobacteraceae bacterium GrIS 1.11]